MKTIENICYGNETLDLYLPDTAHFDLFVYFHGGGLEQGDKGAAATKLSAPYLAASGVAMASCNYRMYPDAKYPDFVEDAATAVHWLSHHIREYGKCERIFVGGSSAGGYLSMMLCFDKRWYAACGDFPVPVCGYFHDAGQPTCHFNVLRERGIDPRRVIIDDSAPLYHIGAEAEYPPMMFVVSDNDMKNRLEQTGLVLSTLRHFGYDQSKIHYRLMRGKHCAYCKAVDEHGDPVLGKMILEFIEKV
ncbi:MAG: alpha/beta hydrolase [Ruminococcaceae bacterium]|nr:alpha/beta hydrolase [Oscillospiraceae bacterium]MBE6703423.1 alpha/beta hydrolase [Oscillospiraceae bacterium]